MASAMARKAHGPAGGATAAASKGSAAPTAPKGKAAGKSKATETKGSHLASRATLAVHAGESADPSTGAVNTPVFLSSTFWYPELPDGSTSDYIYSRYTNPSLEAVEDKIAALEGANGALLFGSGMAAIAAACTALLGAGDRMLVQGGAYGGTGAYLRSELSRFGVTVDALPPGTAPPKVPKGTKLVWMESITNPLLRVADVKAWAKAAHAAGALLVVDATFATPMLQRPLELGADLVMHSCTKYLGGHTDLIAGCLVWDDNKRFRELLWRVRRNTGGILDPHAAFLLGRGMKTLDVRMERHIANAAQVAAACQAMTGIKAVHYPGLASHPDHAIAARALTGGFGGMVTIDLGSKEAAVAFRRRLRLIVPAASLGGVESLASLPIETSHQYATPQQRAAEGVTDGLVRISIGIEDAQSIIADIQQALR